MGAFRPFSGGISQALQLPVAVGSTRDPGTARDGGVVAPSLGSHFPVRAPKSTSPRGGCTPKPSRSRAGGEEGRCWGSPAQPLPHCPPPRVLQADSGSGKGRSPGSRAGLCAPPESRAQGPSGCRIPAMALPSRDLGQVWVEVEQGGWELKGYLAALMLSRGGKEHGPTSSSCLYLPASLAATFTWDFSLPSLQVPAQAKGGAL